MGYSARTLAHCWEQSDGLPAEIAALFPQGPELLLAVPEYKVPLPGGARESQNDLFALVRHNHTTCAMMVEGKVNEPFGPTIGDWFRAPSPGKMTRMQHLCEVLGFDKTPAEHVRYQLLHRAASALIEAERFRTDEAAMIVHSFSPTSMWFQDFAAFAALFDIEAKKGEPAEATLSNGKKLRIGWAQGDPSYLSV